MGYGEALFWASHNGHTGIVRALLEAGADPTHEALAAAENYNYTVIGQMINLAIEERKIKTPEQFEKALIKFLGEKRPQP